MSSLSETRSNDETLGNEESSSPTNGKILPSYTDHNGYLMPKGFPMDGFESALQYKAEANDVFVATYPKCGTTWTQNIIWLILHQGEPLGPTQKMDQLFPHLEEVGAEKLKNGPLVTDQDFRLIKTHWYYSMTPQNPRAKYICVVRNPKDVVVSFYHHTKGFERAYHFGGGSFDDYFELFEQGKVDFGDYFVHLRSWLDHRLDDNVLFLTYEQMRANSKEAILQVASFLDATTYPDQLQANNDAILNKIIEHSSLGKMKADPLRWSSDRADHHTPFVRKGNVGGWNELLKPDQVDRLDRLMQEAFSKEELQLLGEAYYAP